MNTMSLLFQEKPLAYIGLGLAVVAAAVMLVFLGQFLAGKNKKRNLIKCLLAIFVFIVSLGGFMYTALTVEMPKLEAETAIVDQINDNEDYQNFAIQANQLTTSLINTWGASGDISPEKGKDIITNHQVKINALIANGKTYLKAIERIAPKAKLDGLPKVYGDYVVAMKESIQISLDMLTDIQTIKLNQNETVDKVSKTYTQSLMTMQMAINSAAIAINKERGLD